MHTVWGSLALLLAFAGLLVAYDRAAASPASGEPAMSVIGQESGATLAITAIDDGDPAQPVLGNCFQLATDENNNNYAGAACDDSDGDRDGVTHISNLTPGTHWVFQSTYVDGYALAEVTQIEIAEGPNTVTVVSPIEGILTVTVVSSADGATPVVGAWCFWLERQIGDGSYRVAAHVCDANNDDAGTGVLDGTYTRIGLVPGTYRLTQTNDAIGYLPLTDPVLFEIVRGPNTKAIELDPFYTYTSLDIHSVDDQDPAQPVPGNCFQVARDEYNNDVAGIACDNEDGAIDGVTHIEPLEAGTYWIFQATNVNGYALAQVTPVEVVDGANNATVVSPRAANLIVTAVDAANDSPVAGGWCVWLDRQIDAETYTFAGYGCDDNGDSGSTGGPDGVYTFTGVASGTYRLTEANAAAGYLFPAGPVTTTVVFGVENQVTIEMDQAASITVTNLDDDDTPLAGNCFYLFDDIDQNGDVRGSGCVSSSDGRVTIGQVRPGAYYLIQGSDLDGHDRAASQPVTLGPGTNPPVTMVSPRVVPPTTGQLTIVRFSYDLNDYVGWGCVEVIPEDGPSTEHCDDDGDGVLAIDLQPGNYTVHDLGFIPWSANDGLYAREDDVVVDVQLDNFPLIEFYPTAEETLSADAGGPYYVDEGTDVGLSGTGTGSGLTYAWDLDGDGVFETAGESVTFSGGVDGPATLTVTLQVCDDGGTCVTDEAVIEVFDVAPVVSASGITPTREGDLYILSLSAIDTGDDTVTSWTIDWDDGQPAQVIEGNPGSVEHLFDDGGATHDVIVSATDEDGTHTAAPFRIRVQNVRPDATLQVSSILLATDESFVLSFTGQSDPSAADMAAGFTYAWDCDGDTTVNFGGYTPDPSVTCPPLGPGVHRVRGSIQDKDGSKHNYNLDVTVTSLPQLGGQTDWTVQQDATTSFTLGALSDADRRGPYIITVEWGDGSPLTTINRSSPGTLPNRNHSYTTAGTFNVTISATDGDGNQTTASFAVEVTPFITDPMLTIGGPQTATEGSSQAFTLGRFSDDDGRGPYAVTVNWGDGTAPTVLTPNNPGVLPQRSHRYAESGEYTVIVTVVDADTRSAEASFDVTVGNVAPVVNAPAAQTARAGVSKNIRLGSLVDPGAEGSWTATVDWGDGTAPTTLTVTGTGSLGTQPHTYAVAGSYNVTVTVTDSDGGVGSIGFTVPVT
jgi:hypothetical protein